MAQSLIKFNNKPSILSGSAVCGGLELSGPLQKFFDLSDPDSKFGCETWEKAESEMIRTCIKLLLGKNDLTENEVDQIFSGILPINAFQVFSESAGILFRPMAYTAPVLRSLYRWGWLH